MADFLTTKNFGTAIYPIHANETSGLLKRCEPFLTPEQLKSRFFKGISLQFKNGDKFTDSDLKDRINLAMNEAEILLGCVITREAFKEKIFFDQSLYKAFVHIQSEHRPIISLEQLAVVSSDNNTVFELPSAWIEASNFSKGLVNVVPLLAAFGGAQGGSAGMMGGIAFLAVLGQSSFVPAFWQISYTSGLSNKEGNVPVPVNELIGCVAAIAVLSEIAATHLYNSQSQSQDGISQSSSGPGPNIYNKRIEDLTTKRDEIVRKLKSIFSSRWFVGNF